MILYKTLQHWVVFSDTATSRTTLETIQRTFFFLPSFFPLLLLLKIAINEVVRKKMLTAWFNCVALDFRQHCNSTEIMF